MKRVTLGHLQHPTKPSSDLGGLCFSVDWHAQPRKPDCPCQHRLGDQVLSAVLAQSSVKCYNPINMMSHAVASDVSDEERLVAELEALGVRYLSRQTSYLAERPRPADALIAGLVRQPRARVRNAVIAVLLARPDYATWVPGALAQLQPDEQARLRILYSAAVALQQEHARTLRLFLGPRWRPLPDLFARELGVAAGNQSPQDTLKRLGRLQQQQTGAVANWPGTFEDVARRLLRQWELESQWIS